MPVAFALHVRHCTTCEAETAFEQPGCLDGHGADCPEWVCVGCGAALLIGFSVLEPTERVPVSRVA